MTRKLREAREEGFTLIELLVVVIIIGILAAIAIPAFLSVRGNAGDATAQSDLRNAVIHFESYYTSNGAYTMSDEAPLVAAGWEQSTDSTLEGFDATADTFCMVLESNESGNFWAVTTTTNEPFQIAATSDCSTYPTP